MSGISCELNQLTPELEWVTHIQANPVRLQMGTVRLRPGWLKLQREQGGCTVVSWWEQELSTVGGVEEAGCALCGDMAGTCLSSALLL